jgi:hypothetical protein
MLNACPYWAKLMVNTARDNSLKGGNTRRLLFVCIMTNPLGLIIEVIS